MIIQLYGNKNSPCATSRARRVNVKLYKKIIKNSIDKARTRKKTNGNSDERTEQRSGHDTTELKT